MIKELTTIVMALTMAATMGCRQRMQPTLVQKTQNVDEVIALIKKNHGGLVESGFSQIDGDGVKDIFYLAKDGTVYATHSFDNTPIWGLYCDGKTRWYRHNKNQIK